MNAYRLVTLGLLTLSAAGQAREGAEPNRLPDRTVLKGELVTLPFELPRGQPTPLVEVTIDDRGPYRFLVDSGAGACVIATDLAAELGLSVLETTDIGDPSDSARLTADVFEAEVLSLGDFRVEGLPIVGLDRRTFGGTDGILGLPLFHEHLLTIDYPAGVLHVADAQLDEEGEHVVGYEFAGGLPQIELSIGTQTVSTTIDTGSPSGFTLQASSIEGLEWREPVTVVGHGRTVNSEFEIKRGRVTGVFELAGHRFEDPWVHVNDRFPHANLGYEVLGDFALSIDQRGQRMRFVQGGLADPKADLAVEPD